MEISQREKKVLVEKDGITHQAQFILQLDQKTRVKMVMG